MIIKSFILPPIENNNYLIIDEESKEALLGISIFKYYDIDFVKDLMQDCKYNRVLELEYKTTAISKESIIFS